MGRRLPVRIPDDIIYKAHSLDELKIDLKVIDKELKRQRTVMRELELEKQIILDQIFIKELAVSRYSKSQYIN